MKRLIAGLFLAIACLPATAQELDPAILRAMQGSWLVAPLDGRPGCRISLGTGTTIGGYELAFGPDCALKVPRIANAMAWSPVDGLSLIGPTRRSLIRFREQEDATYSTDEPAPGYVMVRAPAGIDRVPLATDAFGDWAMKRPDGEVICRIQLSDKPPAGGQESYALRIASEGCQQAVTRLRLVSWRIETMKLVLYGSEGNSLSFVRTPGGFTKAEGGRPLILERIAW